jgi:hypothetical protein
VAAPEAKPKQYPVLLEAGDSSRIAPVSPDRVICFALYTTQKGVLKLSAQLYPLADDQPNSVTLEVQRDGKWSEIAKADVHRVGWTATFRVENWDASKDARYRVRHPGGSTYEGTIRHDPVDKDSIVAAVFTGNSPGPGGGQISKRDVVENVLKVNPDILIFTGDQVYNHQQHTAHWLKFGEDYGEIIRDRPTVCLPDDHDVGQGNLWGGGGRKVKIDTQGGYVRPAAYVKLIERQQTSHMPDPFDPTPIEQDIGVYYTSLNVGGIDFAIVEDRKFKSGCYDFDIKGKGLGPRPDHINKPDVDPKQFDAPGKKLLGDRQLEFLEQWCRDWDGAVMKALVSQTVFSMTSTYHGAGKTFYFADFDAGGWPQTGRNKAVDAMRRCFAFHICGDQHLSTIGQYGIDEFRDSGWWFCVPSIANLWPRWWQPGTEALRPAPGASQDHTGDFFDGFQNRMTIYAHTNPFKTGREPAALHDRMPGFGVVRFSKPDRKITMECWPRMVDPSDPTSKQYPGWPRTISQTDNYPRRAEAWLPTLKVTGATDPVVEVVDEVTGRLVYALRIQGNTFQPKVFKTGTYTLVVRDDASRRSLNGVESSPRAGEKTISVQLGRPGEE